MTYELHYADNWGEPITGTYDELMDFVKVIDCYWEIHMRVKSSMKIQPMTKMNIEEMKDASRLNKRGYSIKSIAKKFDVSEWYIRRVLSQVKKENAI